MGSHGSPAPRAAESVQLPTATRLWTPPSGTSATPRRPGVGRPARTAGSSRKSPTAGRARARPRLRRGPQRALAGRPRLAGLAVDFSAVALAKGARSRARPAASTGCTPTPPPSNRPAGRPRAALLPAARRDRAPRGRAARRRRAAPGGVAAGHRARLAQPHRRHRRPAGPDTCSTPRRHRRRSRRAPACDRARRRGAAPGRGRGTAGDRRLVRPGGRSPDASRAAAQSALIAACHAAASRPSPGPFISANRTMPSLSTRNVPRLAKPAVVVEHAVGLRDRAVRPEVRQQRELVALALAEDLVRVRRVDADRQRPARRRSGRSAGRRARRTARRCRCR